jgi:H+/Cl- antiporter ClcA
VTGPAGDPAALLRSRGYLVVLGFAAVLGVPVSAAAFGFLALVDYLQKAVFVQWPHAVGYSAAPVWWPLPIVAIGGVAVALAIKYLPGDGGPSPAHGFAVHKPPSPAQLPGVLLAAVATLSFGIVLGPEAPLIALGGGLAVAASRLLGASPLAKQAQAKQAQAKHGRPDQAVQIVAASGTFAAISALLGSPIIGAFLLMEASGLGGPLLILVLLPGLLASGIGALIFTGLGHWTGLGTFSLAIPGLPHVGTPKIGEFGWALVIGLACALVGSGIRRAAPALRTFVISRTNSVLPLLAAGLVVGGLAVAFAAGSGRSFRLVLFSGQSEIGPLLLHSAHYSALVLVAVIACKAVAYVVSLSSFRGGPIFPSMFLGAAIGLLISHLPGLDPVAAAAMGIGAMSAVMLTLPLTSVLLATLLLYSDGIRVMSLVIVAVVVAYVIGARLAPKPAPEPAAPEPAAPLPDAPPPAGSGH